MHRSLISRFLSSVVSSRRQRRCNPRPKILGGERLEMRTMFATLVSPTRVTYQDVDGDNVTVTFSRAILTQSNVNSILAFDTGETGGSNATRQQLRSIDLTGVPSAAGTSITTAAARNAATGGDGLATLGQLKSGEMDLGNVTIDGDLGRITAGDTVLTTPGLGNLNVHSMGRFGTSTGALDLFSVVRGKVSALSSTTDIRDVYVSVRGTSFGDLNGSIESVSIGGSLIGGNSARSGAITAYGAIGTVRIDGDVRGGTAAGSGSIDASRIGNVTIGGSLEGSTGTDSGWIYGGGGLGNVRVVGDIIGGPGSGSASISTNGTLLSLFVGGSLSGGHGDRSGNVQSAYDMGRVQVQGNVNGSWGESSGSIGSSLGKLAAVSIGGSITGDTGEGGNNSGRVFSRQDMGQVTIGGNVEGGYGEKSGGIESQGRLAGVTINGFLRAGLGRNSGYIGAALDVGRIKVQRDVVGGSAFNSGTIAGRAISSVDIGGSLIGGTGTIFGMVVSSGEIAALKIGGDITGGVFADRIGTVTVGGSLIAGAGAYGSISAMKDIRGITIRGDIRGIATQRAAILAGGQGDFTGTSNLVIGRLTVQGSVIYGQIMAGYVQSIVFSFSSADAQIGPVVVGGNWIASNLVAGVDPGADGLWGTPDDFAFSNDRPNVNSKITSIVINGIVGGTPGVTGDHFGFVAQHIGSLVVRGANASYPLRAGASNDNILLVGSGLGSGDVRLREIAVRF